jgi:hypothetical protein
VGSTSQDATIKNKKIKKILLLVQVMLNAQQLKQLKGNKQPF